MHKLTNNTDVTDSDELCKYKGIMHVNSCHPLDIYILIIASTKFVCYLQRRLVKSQFEYFWEFSPGVSLTDEKGKGIAGDFNEVLNYPKKNKLGNIYIFRDWTEVATQLPLAFIDMDNS